jgi:hypothetical protein
MPRFYRHMQHGDQLIEDPEGIELPDLDAARADALRGVRDLLSEAIRKGTDDLLEDAVIITDGSRRELMRIPFSEGLPSRLYEALIALPSSSKFNTRD